MPAFSQPPEPVDLGTPLPTTTLPPDSPWAGTFGGGLGMSAVSGAETVPAPQAFSRDAAPGFDFAVDPLRGSSPALISRPPIVAGRGAGATPSFPCPNCGELAGGNALSCGRCQFRFYAACPSCGEYIDTTEPTPEGGDTCPRCSQPLDKLALGRNEPDGKRGVTAREAIVSQIPYTRPATEKAAEIAINEGRSQSAARTLIGLLAVVAIVVFLLYILPQILRSIGVPFESSAILPVMAAML
jgi:hypothetical protein